MLKGWRLPRLTLQEFSVLAARKELREVLHTVHPTSPSRLGSNVPKRPPLLLAFPKTRMGCGGWDRGLVGKFMLLPTRASSLPAGESVSGNLRKTNSSSTEIPFLKT
jgi:hypothetical protein